MLEMWFGLDFFITAALAAAWLIAGYSAGRLVFQTSWKRMRLIVRIIIAGVMIGTVLLVGKLIVVGGYGSLGWWFTWDKVMLNAPVVVLPCLAALWLSYPRLRRMKKIRKVDGSVLFAAADPLLVVPMQASALGALLSLYLLFFPLSSPFMGKMATVWAVLFGGTTLIAARRVWLYHKVAADGRVNGLSFVGRAVRSAAVIAVLAALGIYNFSSAQQASILPDRYDMGEHYALDFGGGEVFDHGHGSGRMISAADLRGPQTGEPDQRFTLTAQEAEIQLGSGKTIEAWGFNGEVPGPEIRVKQGDLVEVTLRNELSEAAVTIHWHGVNVPNGEDGVAGVTQDAVMPGESFTYRFIAEDAGTYWYHSHQQSSVQVLKGLYGPLIVEPAESSAAQQTDHALDLTLMSHTWETDAGPVDTLNRSDRWEKKAAAPGTEVRLRFVNTSNLPKKFVIAGVPFQVTAIDGVDLNEPDELTDTHLLLAAGGRYTIRFTMPETPVYVQQIKGGGGRVSNVPGIVFSPDGKAEGLAWGEMLPVQTREFDPSVYGSPADTPFGPDSHFDREFVLYLDSIPGFFDGEFHYLWTMNGRVFPYAPTLMVREGELIKMTFINRSFMDHPMHLHGHHMLVLSKNGKALQGTPWWTDTLNVAPGEVYEVGFLADHPGIWMDHCHNLDHAAIGMMMHLAYEGVMTPFEAGRASGNMPE